ncbi:MAG: IS66 family transposase [Pirellulales bacterium]
MDIATDLPQELEACHALIRERLARLAQQDDRLARHEETIEALRKQIEQLEAEQEKLRKLAAHLANGHRSERHVPANPDQRWLPFDSAAEFQEARAEAEAEAEAIVQKYEVTRTIRPKKKRDESFPSHLKRLEKIDNGDEAHQVCPTHGPRRLLGYDVTETLMWKPAELHVLVTKYAKYVCDGEAACGVASPERPTTLVEGGRYDTSVAAAVIDAKWHLHLPIYRQQDVFAGSGWIPSRSTLNNLVLRAAFVVVEFMQYMKARVQNDVCIGLDDTSCRMLMPRDEVVVVAGDQKSQRLAEKVAEAKAKREQSLIGKMWAYQGLSEAPYNIFDFRVSRHRDGPEEFSKNSRCVVMADCYSGNTSVVLRSDERLKLAACWAHARRKIKEAFTYTKERDTLLEMINALYDVETRAANMSSDERLALRAKESQLILSAMGAWLDTTPIAQVLSKSDFAEAVRYIRNHWEALNVYLGDGRVPIDNNSVERLMKQVAMGRKAWLFVSNVESGEQSAMLMSLVSSAKRHDLDVWTYVKDVLDQLLAGSTNYESLLPDVWKRAHPEAVREYRVEERQQKAERKELNTAKRRLALKAAREKR